MDTIFAYWDKEDRAGKVRLAGCGGIAAFLTFLLIFTFCGNGFSLSRLFPPRIPTLIALETGTITATASPTSTIQIETLTALAIRSGIPTSTAVLTATASPTPKFTSTKTATRPPATATLAAPTPTRTSTPGTATIPPFPPTPVGANVACSEIGSAQICAWVSNAAPIQSSNETVFGRLLVNGVPQANQMMNATWDFKPSTVECSAMTGSNGVASCSHGIGHATAGVAVRIVVTINGFTATTSFTP